MQICKHFASCGGCSQQAIDYGEQLKKKQELIEALFTPFLREESLFYPIIASDNPWRYRNKMEFSFSQNLAGDHFLGLIKKGGRRRVEDLEECLLTPPWFLDLVAHVRTWWKESGLKSYHLFQDTGSLRTLTLREGVRTGDKMVMLTVSGNPAFSLSKRQIEQFREACQKALPISAHERLSLFLRIQQIKKGMPTQFFEMHLSGPDHIREECLGMTFKISPTSFFQPNTLSAEKLYRSAMSLCDLNKNMHVFDLYCGTASFSLLFAPHVKRVIAIELNPHAIFDAKMNLELNEITNVELHTGDVAAVLSHLKEGSKLPCPDLVIVDPPRSGLDSRALEHLLMLRPKQILYVSCNPHTQVENVQKLSQDGYQIKSIQPVDQFPHTDHVENIVLLQLAFSA